MKTTSEMVVFQRFFTRDLERVFFLSAIGTLFVSPLIRYGCLDKLLFFLSVLSMLPRKFSPFKATLRREGYLVVCLHVCTCYD